jgi:hypothetical protein
MDGAQSSDTTEAAEPTPTPSPAAFSWSGHFRAYDFNRNNCSGDLSSPCRPKKANAANVTQNQTAFNAALLLHAQYRLVREGWYLGATLVEANPLGFNGACGSTANYAAGASCSQYPPNDAYYATDTSLPAFPLSTLAEAYLAYKGNGWSAIFGDQEFNSPWAGPSDARVKAAYYQGASVQYRSSALWAFDVDRMTQWESRTSSSFNKSDLIVPFAPNGSIQNPTPGFLRLATEYSPNAHVDATAELYQFYDVASLLWLHGTWNLAAPDGAKRSIGVQFGDEGAEGSALVGAIDSEIFGAEAQASAGRNTIFSLSYNFIPEREATIALPAGVACNNGAISNANKVGYWLPSGGTANCVSTGATSARIYFGGVASPYSDSYGSSPLFTNSMAQDMVARRSPGASYKLAATILAFRRQMTIALAEVWNDYSNGAGANETIGTLIDVQYRFRHMEGRYRGLSLRDRWVSQNQSTAQFGGKPQTVANRAQLEYDF